MNIKEAKEEIIHSIKAYHLKDENGKYMIPVRQQRPILLMGPPGIGKTAIMEQIAREQNLGLVAYTITHHTRQSAVGLPKIVEKDYQGETYLSTEYTMSEIVAAVYECIERTGKEEGILFLDEINCVSETLTPTMLQFLQKKMFGNHKIPDGYVIIAAGNPRKYNRSAKDFDVVTLDRVRQLNLEADLSCWLEYAASQRVHGAIISYLKIYEDQFFYLSEVQNDETVRQDFVTARGWEDLSRLLTAYETLGYPVQESQIAQFLQEKNIAEAFTRYYRLYRKYDEDYCISEIIEGTLSVEEYRQKVKMAKNGDWEEQMTVAGLISDAMAFQFQICTAFEKQTGKLYEKLGILKNLLKKSDTDTAETVEEFYERQRKAYEVRRTAGLVTETEENLEEWVLNWIQEFSITVKEQHLGDNTTCLDLLKQQFERVKRERKNLICELAEALDRSILYIQEAFTEKDEMLLFLSSCMNNKDALQYLTRHGSELFLEVADQLLGYQTRLTLQQQCSAVKIPQI